MLSNYYLKSSPRLRVDKRGEEIGIHSLKCLLKRSILCIEKIRSCIRNAVFLTQVCFIVSCCGR